MPPEVEGIDQPELFKIGEPVLPPIVRFFEKRRAAQKRYQLFSPVPREPNPFSPNGSPKRLTQREQDLTFVVTEFGRRCEDFALTAWASNLKVNPDRTVELARALDDFNQVVFEGLENMPRREHAKWLEIWLIDALQKSEIVPPASVPICSPIRLPLLQMAAEIEDILADKSMYFPLPDFETWGSTSENNNDRHGLYAIQAALIAANLICGRIPAPFTGSLFPHVYVEDPQGERRAIFDGITYTPTDHLLVGSPLDEIAEYDLRWEMLEIKSVFGRKAFQRHINGPQKKHLDQIYGELATAAIIWCHQGRDFPFPESATLFYLRGLYPSRRFNIPLGVKFFENWLKLLSDSSLKSEREDLCILRYALNLALVKAEKREEMESN